MTVNPNRPARSPDRGGRWAVLGGVFDPIHRGHMTLARDLAHKLDADGILLVPSFSPPHKENTSHAPFEDRVAMIHLAIGDSPEFCVSRIEADMDQPGYTVNTVRALKRQFPQTEFLFVIGADNILDIRNWYQPEEIFKEIEVIAGSRPGYDIEVPPEYAQNIRVVPTDSVDVSSSEIRKMIKAGASKEELGILLPPAVVSFIVGRKLYK